MTNRIAARALAVLALSCGVLALGACGEPSASDAEETARDFILAFVDSDGERACSYMSDEATAKLEGWIKEEKGTALFGDECSEIVSKLGDLLQEGYDEEKLERVVEQVKKPGKVKIEGNRAEVEFPGDSDVAVLVRDGGSWKVSSEVVDEWIEDGSDEESDASSLSE